jgi:hypothetical protein
MTRLALARERAPVGEPAIAAEVNILRRTLAAKAPAGTATLNVRTLIEPVSYQLQRIF